MWKDEWDFWTSEQADLKLDEHFKGVLLKFARKNLPLIQSQLDLVDTETEIVPGMQASGHTQGYMALAISSGGEQLLCISDAVLHPIYLEHPERYAAVDFAPKQAVATMRRLLNRAATENALCLPFTSRSQV